MERACAWASVCVGVARIMNNKTDEITPKNALPDVLPMEPSVTHKFPPSYAAVQPPSMVRTEPCTNDACGETRYRHMPAISSGVPMRPIGCR